MPLVPLLRDHGRIPCQPAAGARVGPPQGGEKEGVGEGHEGAWLDYHPQLQLQRQWQKLVWLKTKDRVGYHWSPKYLNLLVWR